MSKREAEDADFNESDHPRDEGGKFASIGSAGGKSTALSEQEHQKLIDAGLSEGAYLHNSRNGEIDFLKGGGEYGGAFFLQNSRPAGLSNYGKNVHAFELDPAKTLDVDDERFDEAVRDWMTNQADRGMLESGYENLIDEHGGNVDEAASALVEQIRSMDIVESESSLMDMGEYLSEKGFGAVKTKGGALVYDPVNAMKAHRSGSMAKDKRWRDIIGLDSVRTEDIDGRMRVAVMNISKACVNPYKGSEIPGSEAMGLDPERVYYLYRDPEELAKAAASSNGVQILRKHIPVNAEDHQPWDTVGATGTDGKFEHPYLQNSGSIWAADDIAGIKSGKKKQVSLGYHYVPIMTPGEADGVPYDGIMTNIVVNHLALVEDGRAGPDVVVADEAPNAGAWRAVEQALLTI